MNVVRVGVATLIVREVKGKKHVLLGKRKGSHGSGSYQLPGGHLEVGESFESCARREIKEETDLDAGDLQLLTCTNDIFTEEKKHYVTVFMKCSVYKGEAKVMEPEKCEKWIWVEWEKVEEFHPLFLPLKHFIKRNKHLI